MVAIGAEEKKKLYILLGLAGVLGAVVLLVIKPFGRGSSTSTTATTTPAASSTPATPSGPPVQAVSVSTGMPSVSAGMPSGGAATPGAPGSGTAQLIPLGRYRPDPFAPKVTPAGPPLPRPRPPRPTPTPLPPVSIPTPDNTLAPAIIDGPGQGVGSQAPGIPLNLPPVNISQFTPRTTPRTGASGGGQTGSSGPIAASDKRLAGVVIGDSVRALIEINDGTQTITRVVKPGDDVDGTNIKILSIDRITENGTTVTRMTVLENGQQKYFDLRPASGQ